MDYVDLLVVGDPGWARDAVSRSLARQGFRIRWTGDWSATAERGNRVDGRLLGRRAPHLRLAVTVGTEVSGQARVSVERVGRPSEPGHAGRAGLEAVRDELAEAFRAAGVLVTTLGG